MLTTKDYRWMRMCVEGSKEFSTCGKRQYFCVLVDHHGHVVGTGYNGAPKGFVHCTEGGCPRLVQQSPAGSTYNNCIAIHAEANALLHSDYSSRRDGVTLYVNGPPCWDCAKLAANGGVSKIVYVPDAAYAAFDRVEGLLESAGIELLPIETS